jgi:hypothetical protein
MAARRRFGPGLGFGLCLRGDARELFYESIRLGI